MKWSEWKDAVYEDDKVLFGNTPTQAEFQLHSLLHGLGGNAPTWMQTEKSIYIFQTKSAIFTQNSKPLKLKDQFTYPGSDI